MEESDFTAMTHGQAWRQIKIEIGQTRTNGSWDLHGLNINVNVDTIKDIIKDIISDESVQATIFSWLFGKRKS